MDHINKSEYEIKVVIGSAKAGQFAAYFRGQLISIREKQIMAKNLIRRHKKNRANEEAQK